MMISATWSLGCLAFVSCAYVAVILLGQDSFPYHLPTPPTTVPRPNIVFILTDDQDVHLSSLDYMPYVRKHLIERGISFTRHYCTTAVCCPSRVTLWTGQAAHNTNVTDVNPPYGGYPKFISQGYNDKYLPVWLQDAGYNTYYTGKLFNVHTVDNYHSPYPAGFTTSDFLLDPFTYDYLNSTFQRNREEPRSYEGEYITDVLAEKAYGLLDDAVTADKPFFLTVAPSAPHSNVFMNGTGLDESPVFTFGAPVSAKRHASLFEDLKVPRTESFNPEQPSGANWIRQLPKQNQTNVDYNDHFYRSRIRALQAIDELVDGIFTRLEQHGVMESTYIFYSSDNGYHIGQHRLQPGKSCGYEEDINIPLIIRGPAVEENATSDIVTTHTDLAPTFFQLLGLSPRPDFDGSAFPITRRGLDESIKTRREHVNVEYWGFAAGEGIYDFDLSAYNNTYKSLRVIGDGYDLYYSVWCNNEHEVYDMTNDPQQMNNLYPSTATITNTQSDAVSSPHNILGLPISKVLARLDSLLLVLKTCKGERCVNPWRALHPVGNVMNLKDALSSRFDEFYESNQVRVSFDRCERGYIANAEGPNFDQNGLVLRNGIPWSEWV